MTNRELFLHILNEHAFYLEDGEATMDHLMVDVMDSLELIQFEADIEDQFDLAESSFSVFNFDVRVKAQDVWESLCEVFYNQKGLELE